MGTAQSAANGLYGVGGGVAFLLGLGKLLLKGLQSLSRFHQMARAKLALVEELYIVPDLHAGVALGVKKKDIFYHAHASASFAAGPEALPGSASGFRPGIFGFGISYFIIKKRVWIEQGILPGPLIKNFNEREEIFNCCPKWL